MKSQSSGWEFIVLLVAALWVTLGAHTALAAPSCTAAPDRPTVRMVTTLGTIELLMCSADVPDTVDNFLQYVDEGAYTNTGFVHRSVQEDFFIVQGGGFFIDSGTLINPGPFIDAVTTRPPIDRELVGLENLRGTIAMARSDDPNSATSQWFINVQDNPVFDSGYAVFGEVAVGMDVVDAMAAQGIWAVNTSPFGETPLIDFPNDGVSSPVDYLVSVTDVVNLPEPGAQAQAGATVLALAWLAGRRRRALGGNSSPA
jgi:cyclophilin family peptidyl-prolyl cis-trans isomerase